MSLSPNPVAWFEIYVSDMNRAKAFYESTFEVTLQLLPSPDATLEMWCFPMEMNLPGASGALCKMEGCSGGPGGTMIYFACQDCAVEEARALAAGGKVLKSKFSIGEYGHIAILTDTEGNTIGLHSKD